MSKLVWVNYRISEAEERESRRKIELLRRTLERCAALRQQLSELEPVAGENWSQTLAKYEQLVAIGKPPKKAITAIMRKLVVLANALLRDDRKWSPSRP